MSITYTQGVINSRLAIVQAAIDAASPVPGRIILLSETSQTIAEIVLANPCGTINAGILTFTTPASAPVVLIDGNIAAASIQDGNGNTVATGLTVAASTSADIVMASVSVTASQIITMIYGTITGR